MPLFTPTVTRVTAHTAPEVNERIRREAQERIALLRKQGPQAMRARLLELDREWDIERCLETGAASLTLLGTVLAIKRDVRWLLLPAGVAGFLLQHALQGWCPPLPVFRRLGVRTADEINVERRALQDLLPSTAPAAVAQPAKTVR